MRVHEQNDSNSVAELFAALFYSEVWPMQEHCSLPARELRELRAVTADWAASGIFADAFER